MTKTYIPTLTIAGSDSCGGAGAQADIKTMSALGCYAASAITSITVQNTLGVAAVMAVNPDIVSGQIKAVMDDICPKVVKVGMVNDQATIHAIATTLSCYQFEYLIVDPVMVSTSGSRLMQEDALQVFRDELMPQAMLLTPNIPEAEVLAGMKITDVASCDEAGARIAKGCKGGVLIKGGHVEGDKKQDRLYNPHGVFVCSYVCDTVETINTHGTGCTLSSAIACYLAKGAGMREAIRQAKNYVTAALQAGADVKIGHGHGPVNHFFNPMRMEKR